MFYSSQEESKMLAIFLEPWDSFESASAVYAIIIQAEVMATDSKQQITLFEYVLP